MSTVGQIEKRTQARVVKLFRETLGYDYLGDWIDREGNRNIEPELLSAFLKKQGHDESLITKVLYQLEKAAGDTSKSLYDRNRAVYELLRYGVKVKADVGENTQTVWLIDWKKPHDNYFAIAEEVTVSAGRRQGAHQTAGRSALCQRHRAGPIGTETLDDFRSRRHPPESRQPEKSFYRTLFRDHAVRDGGQRHRRFALRDDPNAEKFYLTWKEDSDIENPLDRSLTQLCGKERFLELIHQFKLAKKPVQCLEYIVVHELVHLLERHHNKTFSALMSECLPQWKARRAELNSAPLAHETWSY